MTLSITTISLPLSAAPSILGQTADQVLASLGLIDIIDIDVTEPQGAPSQPSRTLLITYNTPGTTLYRAVCFGNDTPDGDAADADLFFQNYPEKAGIRMFDISTLDMGKLRRGRTLVFLTDSEWYGTPLPGKQQLFIARTVASIAPGASGTATPLFGDLTTGAALAVRNPTSFSAAIASLGYCFRDPVSGDYLFFPTCCSSLSLLEAVFAQSGYPPGITYPTIVPLGSITDPTIDAVMTFSTSITMTAASSSTGGSSLSSGPSLEAGNTRVRWVFNVDSDYFSVTIDGDPPAATPFAVGGGGEYPPTGTSFTVNLFLLGPPTSDQNLVLGDPLNLSPIPVPTFSETSFSSFEWYKDGVPTGVTSWTLAIANVGYGDAGTYEMYINGLSYSSYGLGGPTIVTVVDPIMSPALYPTSGGNATSVVLGARVSTATGGASLAGVVIGMVGSTPSWTVAFLTRGIGPITIGGQAIALTGSVGGGATVTLRDTGAPGADRYNATGVISQASQPGGDDGNWHLLTIVYDDSINSANAYYDGSLVTVDFAPFDVAIPLEGDLTIFTGGPVEGSVIFWPSALSAADIATVSAGITYPP